MNERIEEILETIESLEAMRRPWDSFWQELAEVVHPRRSILHNFASITPEHERKSFDSTAMRALRTLATGQSARITPMGARWFGLKPDENSTAGPAAVSYYQTASERIAQQLRKSNFYSAITEHYLDRGAFGIAATECRAGKNERGLHFEAYPVGTFSVAEDENGEVDTICRSFMLTPKQIQQRYGEVPECIQKALADPKERYRPMEVVKLIRPRKERDGTKQDKLNKLFESVHILKKEKELLLEDGYDEFPVAVSRWEKWGNSPYGWPPAYMALEEASQANFLETMLDSLAETAAFPRVRYPGGLKGDVAFQAMGLTCYDPTNAVGPEEWLTGGNYTIGKDRLDDKRRAIEEAFFVPLFNGISQLSSDATAEQVRAIVNESREQFHPILAGLNRETLTPLLRRSFALTLRQGIIDLPPQELVQKGPEGPFMDDPALEYTTPMALALDQSQIANFADVMGVLMPIAASDPSVLDFVNWDEIGPEFFRSKGLKESFVKQAEQIQEMRDARSQAAQAQQMEQAAGMVQKLGGAQGIKDISANIPPEALQ